MDNVTGGMETSRQTYDDKLTAVESDLKKLGNVQWAWTMKLNPCNSAVPTFLVPDTDFMENNFSTDRAWVGGWFGDDSSALYLLCTLCLFLLHQLHLRSSDITSQRWETAALTQLNVNDHSFCFVF